MTTMTPKLKAEKEGRTANSTYKWLNEAWFFVSTFVVADSLVLQNRQLLIATKRYRAF